MDPHVHRNEYTGLQTKSGGKPLLKAPAPCCKATSHWKMELGNTVLKGAL